jgi:hypothetical protein
MSVRVEHEIAYLIGDCRVEDAEPLLAYLQSAADRAVDLTGAGHLHTAVVQLLIAFKPHVIGPATDTFVQRWLVPVISAA